VRTGGFQGSRSWASLGSRVSEWRASWLGWGSWGSSWGPASGLHADSTISYWAVLCAGLPARHLTCINSFNPHNSFKKCSFIHCSNHQPSICLPNKSMLRSYYVPNTVWGSVVMKITMNVTVLLFVWKETVNNFEMEWKVTTNCSVWKESKKGTELRTKGTLLFKTGCPGNMSLRRWCLRMRSQQCKWLGSEPGSSGRSKYKGPEAEMRSVCFRQS
jgi:hypothetical protein